MPDSARSGCVIVAARDLRYEDLARLLDALASPPRLRLLHALTAPRTLSALRVPAGEADAGNPDRPISRQAVREHLRRLVEAGLVRVEPGPLREGGLHATYALDVPRLFAVLEEMRHLARLPAPAPPPADTMQLASGVAAAPVADAPHFLVVHGAVEGRSFPLRGPRPDGWIVGRHPAADVRLDWDPYASGEHARIVPAGRAFRLEALRSTNPTTVNFRPLAPGRAHALRHGDVVGAGKSLLVFHEA